MSNLTIGIGVHSPMLDARSAMAIVANMLFAQANRASGSDLANVECLFELPERRHPANRAPAGSTDRG